MKIIELKAHNVKRLTAVEIAPDGNVVVIGGKNGAGKTSVLDSIAYALAGKGSVCETPVRRGAARAKIVCDLGDFTVTRTMTAGGGGALTITGKDGKPVGSPQALLDKLAGALTFDPLKFASMEKREQVETLRGLVGLDFSAADAKRKKLADDRTIEGRDVSGRKTQIDALPEYPDAPTEEVSVAALAGELSQAQRANRDAELAADAARKAGDAVEEEATDLRNGLARIDQDIAQTEAELDQLRKQRAEREAEGRADIARLTTAAETAKERSATFAVRDVAPIQDQMASAEGVNAKVRANATKRTLAAAFAKAKAEYDRLTEEIEKIDADKQGKLAAAKFPVDGLSFDETGVLLNGLPFDQASSAERLRVSVAMALALNPRLRVALIRDGSLLDDDSLKMVAEMAAKADAQVWIERVGEGAECQIVIEDGHVKGEEATKGEEEA